MGILSRKKRTTATIRRIWSDPPPGAPWYYWTRVMFEARGETIEVKLSKRQAKKFVKKNFEGETGHLVYAGKDLVSWEKASPEKPLAPSRDVKVFLSYAHEWADDARYISQVLTSRGLDIWVDSGQLRTGDSLSRSVSKAIGNADYFVALLSPEYFASPWCVRELETAAQDNTELLPIKVSAGDLALPPHVRDLYEGKLGEPVFLDLRKRDPTTKLAELAEQMLGANG
jgi:hypothetical protein